MNSDNQIYPVVWQDDRVLLIDQTRLPEEYSLVAISRSADLAQAIKTMIVRGAPAIGVAAAYGMYLGAREIETDNRRQFLDRLQQVADRTSANSPYCRQLILGNLADAKNRPRRGRDGG